MTRIYHWEWKSLFGYLPFAVLFGVLSFIFAILFTLVLQGKNNLEARIYFLVLFGFLMGSSGLVFLFFLIIPVLQVLFGYLKISPNDFEYQRWPFAAIRGHLDQIEKVQQGTLNLNSSRLQRMILANRKYATLLIRRRKPSKEILMGNLTLGSAKYYVVPLSELEGWADGSLEKTLRTYAPHAFI